MFLTSQEAAGSKCISVSLESKITLFLYMWVVWLHLCLCMLGAWAGQKRDLDLLELEFRDG